jgi:hypothetical protein
MRGADQLEIGDNNVIRESHFNIGTVQMWA